MARRPDQQDESSKSLPLRGSGRTHDRIVIAHHLILHGYGQWLANDPRGSGSDEIREEKFADLGPIHHGRKRVQPSREELRAFYRGADPLLDFAPVWFDDAKREAVGDAFSQVVARRRYTVWGCAVLRNHAHLCIRRHRDDALTMWNALANAARDALRGFSEVADNHPVWSNRPYKVFLYTPDEVRGRVRYIKNNPQNERLPAQQWSFVQPYDGWPCPANKQI